MREHLYSARDWFVQKADGIHAKMWLAVLSFTESCVFVIPPDPLLVAMTLARKDKWIKYVTIVTVASIVGATIGYGIGAIVFDTIGVRLIAFYHLQEYMAQATELIHKSVFVFTFTAAFTPIPFKVAVLAAGFTKANFFAFIIATIGGRGARYALIAFVAKVFGNHAAHIMKRFWVYTTIIGVCILVFYFGYLLFW